MVAYAANDYAPNHLTDWLFRLASAFNSFYERLSILQAPESDRVRRLALTQAVRDTLARGLELLGISAPQRL
jgi:arginyl-tRNA synthetase